MNFIPRITMKNSNRHKISLSLFLLAALIPLLAASVRAAIDPWQSEVVQQNVPGELMAVGIDRQRNNHEAYVGGTINQGAGPALALNYAITVTTGIWTNEVIYSSTSILSYNGVAMAINLDRTIVYVAFAVQANASTSVLYLATKQTTGWLVEPIISTNSITGVSLAMNRNNEPRIVYTRAEGGLHYVRNASSPSWVVSTVDARPGIFRSPSIAIDLQNNPQVSYAAPAPDGTRTLRYAKFSTTTWSFETVQTGPDFDTSLAIDANNLTRLAFIDKTASANALRYAERGASGWQVENLLAAPSLTGLSMALDPGVTAGIIAVNGSTRQMVYYRKMAGVWENNAVDQNVGDYTSLKISGSGQARVGYNLTGGAGTKFARTVSSDTVPPTLSVMAPANGATIAGMYTVSGTAADNAAVPFVRIQVDNGDWIGATGNNSWFVNLNTSLYSNGAHTIRVQASDANNNITNSQPISVTIANTTSTIPDTTNPQVGISFPANGATVSSGNVLITGSASDAGGVARVEVQVDNDAYQLATGSTSWNLLYNFGSKPAGNHVVRARATDRAGNQAVATINVTVQGSTGNPQPSVAPVISAIQVLDIGPNSARIQWTTDIPADSRVEYGSSTAYGATASDGSLTTNHSVVITGLCPNIAHHFRVRSRSGSGGESVSADQTFNTPKKKVSEVVARSGSNTVSWNYEMDDHLKQFICVRSTAGYPTKADGQVVYTGRDPGFNDSSAELGVRYYYTIYSESEFGATADPASIAALIRSKEINAGSVWRVVNESGETVGFASQRVVIPPQTFQSNLEVTLDESVPGPGDESIAVLKSKGYKVVGNLVEVGPHDMQFSQPVNLILSYDPAAIQPNDEKQMKVAFWNPKTRDWEFLKSTTDSGRRTVTASTTHFSRYAIVAPDAPSVSADFLSSYAYPNPAKNAGEVNVRIEAGQAQRVDIRIYNDAGERVHDASVSEPELVDGKLVFNYRWDVRNVPSGVYVYSLEAIRENKSSLRTTEKLAVLK